MALNGVLTYWELSYPGDAFEKFLLELQEYLKSTFKPVLKVDGDICYAEWDCGLDHENPYLDWQPIRNIIGFCEKKGVDDVEVVNMIDDYLGRVFFCECELVSDLEILI